MSSIPLPTTTKNGRVARLVVIHFYYTEFTPKCLTSNPLSQIVTSNPRLQPDTHFAVDMFPYKKTELFQKYGFKSKPPKKPGNTPLSGLYLSFLDIKTTVSTWLVWICRMSWLFCRLWEQVHSLFLVRAVCGNMSIISHFTTFKIEIFGFNS